MVTVNELFAGFVSVPIKLATPVSAMEPACGAIALIVTVNSFVVGIGSFSKMLLPWLALSVLSVSAQIDTS